MHRVDIGTQSVGEEQTLHMSQVHIHTPNERQIAPET